MPCPCQVPSTHLLSAGPTARSRPRASFRSRSPLVGATTRPSLLHPVAQRDAQQHPPCQTVNLSTRRLPWERRFVMQSRNSSPAVVLFNTLCQVAVALVEGGSPVTLRSLQEGILKGSRLSALCGLGLPERVVVGPRCVGLLDSILARLPSPEGSSVPFWWKVPCDLVLDSRLSQARRR